MSFEKAYPVWHSESYTENDFADFFNSTKRMVVFGKGGFLKARPGKLRVQP